MESKTKMVLITSTLAVGLLAAARFCPKSLDVTKAKNAASMVGRDAGVRGRMVLDDAGIPRRFILETSMDDKGGDDLSQDEDLAEYEKETMELVFEDEFDQYACNVEAYKAGGACGEKGPCEASDCDPNGPPDCQNAARELCIAGSFSAREYYDGCDRQVDEVRAACRDEFFAKNPDAKERLKDHRIRRLEKFLTDIAEGNEISSIKIRMNLMRIRDAVSADSDDEITRQFLEDIDDAGYTFSQFQRLIDKLVNDYIGMPDGTEFTDNDIDLLTSIGFSIVYHDGVGEWWWSDLPKNVWQ